MLDNAEAEFRSLAAEHGLLLPPSLKTGPGVSYCGTDSKPTGKDGRYQIHLDGHPAGWVQNMASDHSPVKWKFSGQVNRETFADVAAQARQAEERRQAEADRAREDAQNRERFTQLWDAANEAPHEYLTRKGVGTHGTRAYAGKLYAAALDVDGNLHGVQRLDCTPKLFEKGSHPKGRFFPIGTPGQVIAVSEGMATGATIHEATGHFVACAFGRTGLLPAAQALAKKYPQARLVIAADDDHATEGNPGLTDATEAARALNCKLAVPAFTGPRGPKDTDFNDQARLEGKESVAQAFAAVLNTPDPKPTVPPDLAPLVLDDPSDIGNGLALASEFQNTLRYALGLGWLSWDGHRWAPDTTGAVTRAAWSVADRMLQGAEDELNAARTAMEAFRGRPGAEDDGEARAAARARLAAAKPAVKHAVQTRGGGRIKTMIDNAKDTETVRARVEDFDQHHNELVVANGTIDLETGTLRASLPADLSTRMSPVVFDPTATCPRWDQFMREVFLEDEEMIEYVQRAVGYSLSGDMTERVFFFLYGVGANGKSVFIETIGAMMGDYRLPISMETLAEQKNVGGAGPRSDLVRLRGSRLATASEGAQGMRLDERLIKELTGGEPVVARALYEAEISFHPTCKIWCSTNHLPGIRDTSESIWDRLHLIPFEARFTEGQRDPGLKAKLMEELPGILAWAARGYQAWRERGLEKPQAVKNAGAGYRTGEDTISVFLGQTCKMGADLWIAGRDLTGAYHQWCTAGAERPMTSKRFLKELRRLLHEGGFEEQQKRIDGKVVSGYRGLALLNA
jgi:P4 family phage/plasmid primase-like protien